MKQNQRVVPSNSKLLKSSSSSSSDEETVREEFTRLWVEHSIEATEKRRSLHDKLKKFGDVPKEDYISLMNEFTQIKQKAITRKKKREKSIMATRLKALKARKREDYWANKPFGGWENIRRTRSLKASIWYLVVWICMKIWICYKRSRLHSCLLNVGAFMKTLGVPFHCFSCVILGIWASLMLLVQILDKDELIMVFGNGNVPSTFVNRGVGIASGVLLLIASINGLVAVGTTRALLCFYVLTFSVGLGLFISNEIHERSYAVEDGVDKLFRTLVWEYLWGGDVASHDFLDVVQKEFRCCGRKGPNDYVDWDKQIRFPNRSQPLPLSCCFLNSGLIVEHCPLITTKDIRLQISINQEGCVVPLKAYLNKLYKAKEFLYYLMVFVSTTTFISLINLYLHYVSVDSLEMHEDTESQFNSLEVKGRVHPTKDILSRRDDYEDMDDFVEAVTELINEDDFNAGADPHSLDLPILRLNPSGGNSTESLDQIGDVRMERSKQMRKVMRPLHGRPPVTTTDTGSEQENQRPFPLPPPQKIEIRKSVLYDSQLQQRMPPKPEPKHSK